MNKPGVDSEGKVWQQARWRRAMVDNLGVLCFDVGIRFPRGFLDNSW